MGPTSKEGREKKEEERGRKRRGRKCPNVKVSRITLHDSIVYNEQFTRNYSAALCTVY